MSPRLWNGISRMLLALSAVVAFSVSAAAAPERPSPAEGTGEPFMGALLIDATGSHYRDATRLDRLVEDLGRSPFNDFIIQVTAYGEAYYDSKILPRALGVSEEFDPLGAFIKAIKPLQDSDRPRRVWAWIEPLRIGNINRAVPVAPNHVASAHTDWLARNATFKIEDAVGNQYLEPGLKEVREHLAAIAGEVAKKYDIAGIVIGDLRYPEFAAEWGYHPRVLNAWREATGKVDQPSPGDRSWQEFRREIINETLDAMSRAARSAKQGMRVSASALAAGDAPESMEEFQTSDVFSGALQDWPRWMDENLVDFVILENYRAEGAEAEQFDLWNEFAARVSQQSERGLVVAVAGSRNISLDVLSQIRRVRHDGLMGAALANYREPIQDASSRELFFRALGNTELAVGSQQLPMSVEAIAAAPEPAATPVPTPPIEVPPPPSIETAEGTMIGAEGETEERRTAELSQLTSEAARRLNDRPEALVEPAESARALLRRKFPNIF